MNPITPAKLAAYFDHTQLRAYAQRKDFEKLCAEAREYGFAMVAINPAPVSLCKDLLAGHIGPCRGSDWFPLGAEYAPGQEIRSRRCDRQWRG